MIKLTTILIFLNLFFVLIPVEAQSLILGLKSGLNISNTYGNDVGNLNSGLGKSKAKKGFITGLFFNYPFTKTLSIQPEFLFTMKGNKWNYDDYGSGASFYRDNGTFTLNYLEVPILFKVKFDPNNIIKPNLFVGPYIAKKLSSHIKGDYLTTDEYGNEVNSTFDEHYEYTKDNDFGVVVGGGIDLKSFLIEVRYSLGLTSTNNAPKEFGGPYDEKNRVISFIVGYSMNFGSTSKKIVPTSTQDTNKNLWIVNLKNGKTIKGTIISRDEKILKIETELGIIEVDTKDIATMKPLN